MSSNNIEVRFPNENQEGTKSVVARWLKQIGDQVKLHEPLVEISTDKVSVEIPSPATGVLREIVIQPDADVAPGELLGVIAEANESWAANSDSTPKHTEKKSTGSANTDSRLSPAVKQLLKQHSISADEITGSGKDGRITHEDVTAFLTSRSGNPATGLNGRMVPHTPMRRMIAEHMVQSLLHTAPHVTTVFDCDLEKVLADRAANKAKFEGNGVRLTLTAYFVKAAVKALQLVPEVNSRFHKDALEIFDSCNIGIATALEKDGLIVPVIKEAEKLSLLQIAEALQSLTTRARDGKLSGADVQGGTFTITNHGVSGSLIATPIISQPQSAILGIGKLERRAVIVDRNGKEVIEPRSRAYMTLTIDHRALDGFVANSFMSAFVSALENWDQE